MEVLGNSLKRISGLPEAESARTQDSGPDSAGKTPARTPAWTLAGLGLFVFISESHGQNIISPGIKPRGE